MTQTTHTPPLPHDPARAQTWPRTPGFVLRAGRARAAQTQAPGPAQGPGRLVVVSNHITRDENARCGHMAMLLRSVLRMHGGLWFGCSGVVKEPPALTPHHDKRDGFDSVAIDFNASDHEAFYDGFHAHVVHPMLRSRLNDMAFNRDDLAAWFRINARLATQLKTQLRPDDRIWVNDFHLLPLANELRALGVNNRIGLLVHDTLPACNILASVPDHDRVFSGLAAYDLVGVQSERDLATLRDYLVNFQHATDGFGDHLRLGKRTMRVSTFPVGIDAKHMAELAQGAEARAPFRKLRSNLGAHKLLIGVDRPDHANGLCQRMDAIDHLLEQSPELAGTFSMLQISPPVRHDMPRCRELDRELCRCISDVNGRHSEPDWSPVRYLRKDFRPQVLAGYLRAADVGLMTPLHDGMTLMAKEYVACQDPSDPGVLVLSRFAGAADELIDAVQVNPLDADDMASGIRIAMAMPLQERQARWEALMVALRRQDLARWSNDFMDALSNTSTIGSTQVAAIRSNA